MKELTLSEIWIYPIKSLGGIRLNTTKVMAKGLAYDRRWMLVDDDGVFMTQRIHPRMALFKLVMEDNHLTITFETHSLTLPFNPPSQHGAAEVKIWDDTVAIQEVSALHNTWFSARLGINCKLVYFPESNPRPVDPHYTINEDHVSLADGYPFLIIGQSSLDDLNSRLDAPLPMNRFRPNLVFTGGDAYEEDTWSNFKIGQNHFVGVKPCSRCVLITVNQETAEKSPEPLKTLATYRKRDNKIYFGQNVIAIDHDYITIGDTIIVN